MKHFRYYTPLILQKIGYSIFYFLYKIFVCIEIRGGEHLVGLTSSPTQPIIIASNHTHELDSTAVPLALPFFSPLFPFYFVTNATEKYKTFGWRSYIYGETFFNLLGGYAIYSGHKDYATSLQNHIELLKQGHAVFIFPEGKRTRDGNLNPARGGLGFLVYETHATVVPVAVDTFFNLSLRDFLTFQRKVVLTVGAPILASELATAPHPTVEDYQRASQVVLDRIGNVLA